MKTGLSVVCLSAIFHVWGCSSAEKNPAGAADTPNQPEFRIVYADSGLNKAVQEKLGKAEVGFSAAEIASIEELDASGYDIENLAGIENLKNLNALKLSNNRIVDIGPLASLTDLYLLELNNNGISDISPLASLIELEILEIRSNRIKDIAPLRQLAHLRRIELSDNPLESFDPLGEMDGLRSLALSRDQFDRAEEKIRALGESGVSVLVGQDAETEQAPVYPLGEIIGSKIAFVANLDGRFFDIYAMDAQERLTRLTEDPFVEERLQWSPDGEKILYERKSAAADYDIFVLDAASGASTRLADSELDERNPVWSPDGTRIAYLASAVEGSQLDLVLADPDGGNARRFALDIPWRGSITWDAGGKIYCSVPEGFFPFPLESVGIYEFDVQTAEFRQVTADQEIFGHRHQWEGGDIAVSPVGPQVALVKHAVINREAEPPVLSRSTDLVLFDVVSREETNVTDAIVPDRVGTHFVASPTWSPDGGRLMFVAYAEWLWADLYVVDRDGRNLVRLFENDRLADGALTQYLYPSWSPR